MVGHHLHCIQIMVNGSTDRFQGHYQLHSGSGHGQAQVAGEVGGIATEGEGVDVGDIYRYHPYSGHNIIINNYK